MNMCEVNTLIQRTLHLFIYYLNYQNQRIDSFLYDFLLLLIFIYKLNTSNILYIFSLFFLL